MPKRYPRFQMQSTNATLSTGTPLIAGVDSGSE